MPTPISERTYARPELLAETGWLADRLADPSIRIVDARSKEQYEGGHIAGAVDMYGFGSSIPRAESGDMGVSSGICPRCRRAGDLQRHHRRRLRHTEPAHGHGGLDLPLIRARGYRHPGWRRREMACRGPAAREAAATVAGGDVRSAAGGSGLLLTRAGEGRCGSR
jgi:rhodanese-related sulfurtransferase